MIALTALFLATASAPPPDDVDAPPIVHGGDTCVPMRFSDGMPVIEAKIGEKSLNLGFDTGAPGGPGMSQTAIDAQKLRRVGDARISDPSGKNALTVGLYELRALKIGGITIDKWVVAADPPLGKRQLAPPDGIIGLTAFAGYVVTLDYPGRRILFTKGKLPAPDGKSSFHYEGEIPGVALSLEGHPIEARIDTGNARYGLIIPEKLAAQLAGYPNRFPIGSARTVSNKFDLMAVPVRESKAGEFPLYVGTAAFPSIAGKANIGSLVLQDMVVKVDPANSIVSLQRATPGLESGCPNA